METFVDNISVVSEIFSLYECILAPAHQIGQGRKSGGVLVLIKKSLTCYFKHINCLLPNIICCKFSKQLFSTEYDVAIIFTYVHPQNSKWYQQSEIDCDIANIDSCLSDILQDYKDVHFVVCGDLNGRVGVTNPYASVTEQDSPPWSDDDAAYTGPQRQSDDKTTNLFGTHLLTLCEVFDLVILNGFCDGDREGKFTYVSTTGSSVIDYFLCSYELLQLNLIMTVGSEILSQHFPVELCISRNHECVNARGQAEKKQVTKII